jgi:hypothetical protein
MINGSSNVFRCCGAHRNNLTFLVAKQGHALFLWLAKFRGHKCQTDGSAQDARKTFPLLSHAEKPTSTMPVCDVTIKTTIAKMIRVFFLYFPFSGATVSKTFPLIY